MTKEKDIIGIDYSYTSPAICILGEDFKSSQFYYANQNKKVAVKARNYQGTLISKDWKDPIERYTTLALWAVESIKPHITNNTKIILENYAFGSRAGLLFNIAENAAILKFHLKREFDIFPDLISPTEVKKKWSGKGNAKKEQMVDTLKEKEGIDIVEWMCMNKLQSPAHDMVDSYAIARTGLGDNNK